MLAPLRLSSAVRNAVRAEQGDGPFEAQPSVVNIPFESLPASLEGSNQGMVGVSLSSLPGNAVSYYEVS